MTTDHQRKVIRDSVVRLLVNSTDALDRVFPTRVATLRKGDLPALAVYALEESVDPESFNTAPRELTRKLQLAIEVYVRQGENVDDAVDAICVQVERAMDADETFGKVCGRSILASTQITVIELGDLPVGVARLVYDVTYYTSAPDAADVTPDDLKTIDAKTSLEGIADSVEDKLTGLDQ